MSCINQYIFEDNSDCETVYSYEEEEIDKENEEEYEEEYDESPSRLGYVKPYLVRGSSIQI